jgi:hypothetical protein
VLDEAVLLEAHAVVGILDRAGQHEQLRLLHLGVGLELAEALRALAGPSQIAGELEHLLTHLGQHDQRQLGVVHLLGDATADALEILRLLRFPCLVALREQRAQALHRALDARRDLARLLVTDGLGELRARVRQRAQLVPAVYDVSRTDRHGIQRLAELLRRRLELLGEHDLFFTLERAGAADLLEVRLQGTPLATRIEVIRRDRSRCAGGARRRRGLGGFVGLIRLHNIILDAQVQFRSSTSDTARGNLVSSSFFMVLTPPLQGARARQ